MNILYFLIPLSIVMVVIIIYFFLWTIKNEQYDDLDGPAHRILMDDDDPLIPHNNASDTLETRGKHHV